MFGEISQMTGNPQEDIVALYDQYVALRRELNDIIYNLDSENISELNATIIRTAASGARIELKANGIISFNGNNQLHGLVFDPSAADADFSLYYQGTEYFKVKRYDIGIGLSAFGNTFLYYHNVLGAVWTNGVWDCSAASFVYLTDGIDPYVTSAYAAKKGSFTSGDTHSHTVDVGGTTYTTSSESHYHVQN
ncbi:MAG: hypothetical protein ACYCYE_18425 [Clostridia bacterium]